MNEEDYEKEEAQLDADIAKMLNLPPATSDSGETDTISAEPAEIDSSASDQSETEPTEDMVPISRLKNTQAKMTIASQENAELRRNIQALQDQVNQLLQAQPQDQAPIDNDDDLNTVMDDYPEIAGPLVKKNKMLEQKIAQLEQMLTGVKQTSDRYVANEQKTAEERHWSAIRAGVPDYDELVSDDNVNNVIEWVNSQAPIIKQGFFQGSADDVVTVFNLYKQAQGLPVEKPDNLAAAKEAATPRLPKNTAKPASNKTTFTREQIAKMSMDQFMKHEAEIDEAVANGQIY